MTDTKELIGNRAINQADSLRVTYKVHFAAANFYRMLSKGLDAVVFAAAAVIVIDTIWRVLPAYYLIIPALLIAGATGYRRGANISERERLFRESAKGYHSLFDEYRDFICITLEVDDIGDVRNEFNRLGEHRRELNRNMPDAHGLWYRYVKWKGEDRMNQEISTTDESREAILSRTGHQPTVDE